METDNATDTHNPETTKKLAVDFWCVHLNNKILYVLFEMDDLPVTILFQLKPVNLQKNQVYIQFSRKEVYLPLTVRQSGFKMT